MVWSVVEALSLAAVALGVVMLWGAAWALIVCGVMGLVLSFGANRGGGGS